MNPRCTPMTPPITPLDAANAIIAQQADEMYTIQCRLDRAIASLRSIRALKPRRMGDHWTWAIIGHGRKLRPDDVFDLCDEGLEDQP